MNITEDVKNNVARIYLDGRFDAETCGLVEQFIRKKVEEGTHKFVLNMEKVQFIASAGLRVVLVFAKELRQKYQGDLCISSLQPKVNKVFEISGLNSVLRIYDDMETATQSFNSDNFSG